MFSYGKARRLLIKRQYDHVFEKAKKIITAEFVVLFRENNLGYSRLGLALSKKMIAKAHDRNRVKRLIKEGFRHKQLPSVDIVFLARHGVAKQTNPGINTQLDKTWEKLILCCGK